MPNDPFPPFVKGARVEVVEGPDGQDYVSVNGQHAATLYWVEGGPTEPGEFVAWLASLMGGQRKTRDGIVSA